MFTADPATGDAVAIVIEAAFGLGEVVVGGQVEPDTYVVAKDGPRVRSTSASAHKAIAIVRGPPVATSASSSRAEDSAAAACSTDDEVLDARARSGMRVEQHYGAPQDMEWAMRRRRASGSCSPGRSRRSAHAGTVAAPTPSAARTCWSPGSAPSPGVASGRVRVAALARRGRSASQPGEVLVAPMTKPGLGADDAPRRRARHRRRRHDLPRRDRQPRARRAVRRRHARGHERAPRRRGGHRRRRAGRQCSRAARGRSTRAGVTARARRGAPVASPQPSEPLATRLYVNLAIADQAERGRRPARRRRRPAAGRVHDHRRPRRRRTRERLLARGRRERVRRAHGGVAAAHHPRVRAAAGRLPDRSTSAPTSSAGSTAATEFEPVEENPMIGYRGCYRYVNEPELFALELERARAGARARRRTST